MPFPIEEKYIKETEDKLNLIFPDSFKSKMIKLNGGKFQTKEDECILIPIKDNSSRKRLQRTCNDIIYEYNEALNRECFSKKMIPIAQNGFGDYLILINKTKNKLEDEIYFWSHESGEITLK